MNEWKIHEDMKRMNVFVVEVIQYDEVLGMNVS